MEAVPAELHLDTPIVLSEEQREGLAALLSETAEAGGGAVGLEYVAQSVDVSLEKLSVTLVEADMDSRSASRTEVAQLLLREFTSQLDFRAAGLRLQGSLASLELYDCAAAPGSMGHVVRPAPFASASAEDAPQWRFGLEQHPAGRVEDLVCELTVARF